jgi:hypothetical protein
MMARSEACWRCPALSDPTTPVNENPLDSAPGMRCAALQCPTRRVATDDGARIDPAAST